MWGTRGRGGSDDHQTSGANLGLSGQHVVPQDGGPAAGQLAHVGDDHHGQRHGLEVRQQQQHKDMNTQGRGVKHGEFRFLFSH